MPSPEQRLDLVLSRLERVKKVRSGYMALCPSHEDHSPSLSVSLGETTILLHCWAGCTIDMVRLSIGLEWGDLFYDSRRSLDEFPKRSKPAFTQERRRAMALEALACAMRLQSEATVLARLRDERGWAAKALQKLDVGWTGKRLSLLVKDKDGQPHDILLYDPFLTRGGRKMLAGEGRSRLPWPPPESVEVPKGEPLWIVEGEGSAISLASLGLPCVALPGSISKPSYDPSSPGNWRGVGWHPRWTERFPASNYVFLPDCDEQGRQLMIAAEWDMARLGVRTTFVDLSPTNTSGFDIGDWLRPARTTEQRKTARGLLQLLVKTAESQPDRLDEVRDLLRSWYTYAKEESPTT